jgi:hypothetical protein
MTPFLPLGPEVNKDAP